MGSCLSSDGGGGSGASSDTSSPSSQGPNKKRGKKGVRKKRPEDLQHLHKIPGRLFLNGGSSVASLFTQQGKKGTNQDAMIVWENFASRTDAVFCGVFDGHGPYGHMVARRVRDSLPLKLSAQWEVNDGNDGFVRGNHINTVGDLNPEEIISLCLDDKLTNSINLEQREKYPEIFSILRDSFLKAFKVMDKELKLHPSIDCFCSGTTAVTLVKHGKNLVIGNCGDSRAVLGTRDSNDRLVAVQLTVDLKPNLPKEEERIKRCKGRVFALRDEPDVARVWLPNYDSPGLAMARAFGDFCLKNFGLISVPEISYRRLTEKDEFIVLASDGVWDVLTNKEVVDIVASAPSRSTAARKLVESAVRSWRDNYPTSKIDDCAVVCLFLSDNSTEVTSTSINNISPNNINDSDKSQDLHSSGTQEENKGKGKEMGGEEHAFTGIESHSRIASVVNSASLGDGDDWSALEGVSRANTLLTLPRFSVAGEKRSGKLNYHSYMTKTQKRKWSKSETEAFYEAVRQFGTDFEMIRQLFPGTDRNQVKSKYKKEEKENPLALADAITNRSKDHSHFEKVIELLKAKAEEESILDDADGDPAVEGEDAINEKEEERCETEKEEQEANDFGNEANNSEKYSGWDGENSEKFELDGGGASGYEDFDW